MPQESAQHGWVEFPTPEIALQAQQAMHNQELMGHRIIVELTALPTPQPAAEVQDSRVLLLCNLIKPGDVDEDFAGEVKEECEEIGGEVEHVEVFETPQEVRVFVVFADVSSVMKAQPRLHNRFFAGKRVVASPYPQKSYMDKIWNL